MASIITKPNGSGQSIGKQKGKCVSKKAAFLLLIDLANELDKGVVEKGPDHLLEIVLVNLVHFRRDLEGDSGAFRNVNCPVGAFLRGDPAQKGKVIAALGAVRAYPRG